MNGAGLDDVVRVTDLVVHRRGSSPAFPGPLGELLAHQAQQEIREAEPQPDGTDQQTRHQGERGSQEKGRRTVLGSLG